MESRLRASSAVPGVARPIWRAAARTSAGTTAVLSQDVGQVLTIPTAEPEISESEDDSSWSETLLAFFDSLGRPIVGLAVRLVSGETETHATTDAGGRVPSVKGKAQGETIAIHVKKHPARGGGEKEVASYSPRPGKQTVRVQSGMHVEKTKLRQDKGKPSHPPRVLKPGTGNGNLETRTGTGQPITCSVGCECPNADDLYLGVNNVYRDWVKKAATRSGLMPQAVAAVMNAEAAKDKTGKWEPNSKSSKSSATGMTQFLDASWIGEAVRNGTYLHDKCVKEGWLSQDDKGAWRFKKSDATFLTAPGLERKLRKLLTGRRKSSDKNLQKLLNLRYEPEFAIMAAMDYAKANLANLAGRGYAVDSLNEVEKARIMYLCHHLGLADAIHFIQNTIPEESVFGTNKKGKMVLKQNGARSLLITQIGLAKAVNGYIKPNDGSWVKGHRAWLKRFVGDHIKPSVFYCPGERAGSAKASEGRGDLLDITESLVQ